jgi:hypothetical protein
MGIRDESMVKGEYQGTPMVALVNIGEAHSLEEIKEVLEFESLTQKNLTLGQCRAGSTEISFAYCQSS